MRLHEHVSFPCSKSTETDEPDRSFRVSHIIPCINLHTRVFILLRYESLLAPSPICRPRKWGFRTWCTATIFCNGHFSMHESVRRGDVPVQIDQNSVFPILMILLYINFEVDGAHDSVAIGSILSAVLCIVIRDKLTRTIWSRTGQTITTARSRDIPSRG